MIKDTTKRRKRGEGSISPLNDGRFKIRITLPGYPQYSDYADTEEEAVKKLAAFKTKVDRNEAITKKIYVRDYIRSWLTTYKQPQLKPSSYDRKESTFKNHIENSWIGRCQLGNITSHDIQKLINEKAETLSYSSIKKIYELLDECFRNAVIRRELNYNPVDGVSMPRQSSLKIKTKEIEILSYNDLEKIATVQSVAYNNGNIRFKYVPAFLLMVNTGVRAGEALALTWDCVDFKKSTITINKAVVRVKTRSNDISTKTESIVGDVKTSKSKREIPLNKVALESLECLKDYQEIHKISTPYVIATTTGNMVLHGSFQRLFDRVLEYGGVKHVGLHSLRHTFATNLIDNGADIKEVSTLLGHSSVTITYNTYVHPDLEKLTSAVDLLNK